MRIATIVLTAPRPKPTLPRTLDSLERAGFPAVNAWNDTAASGHFQAWVSALRWTVARHPDADACFVVEDDTVFCRGLREYLQRTLWPGPVEQIALCSPYCPRAYRQDRRGWNDVQSNRGFYLAGSQAWIIPRLAAQTILADVAPLQTAHNADWEIGKWAKATGRKVWYHTPSLAQHVGIGNSALGDNSVNSIRRAGDFIGEEATP